MIEQYHSLEILPAGLATSFTVTPDSGYQIGDVSGCGGSLVDNTYTTAPVDVDCTVTATFTQIIIHSLSVTIAGQGTVNSSPGTDMQCTDNCTQAQDYVENTIVILTSLWQGVWMCPSSCRWGRRRRSMIP